MRTKRENGRVQAAELGDNNRSYRPRNLIWSNLPCLCRIGQRCLICRRWDRKIRGIDARRADNLRRQALGERALAGR